MTIHEACCVLLMNKGQLWIIFGFSWNCLGNMCGNILRNTVGENACMAVCYPENLSGISQLIIQVLYESISHVQALWIRNIWYSCLLCDMCSVEWAESWILVWEVWKSKKYTLSKSFTQITSDTIHYHHHKNHDTHRITHPSHHMCVQLHNQLKSYNY